MGTNFRYISWQPITTSRFNAETRPPYYGNIAAGAMVGNSTGNVVRVEHLPLNGSEIEAAYAAYENAVLKRVIVINLRQYNYTVESDAAAQSLTRRTNTYYFNIPMTCAGVGTLHRLIANGSDATTGVTWDGLSYAHELDLGKPVRMENVTRGETVYVGADGMFQVDVPESSACMVSLKC